MRADRDDRARAAFERDALPWLENVRRFAVSLCRDAVDADDLTQETYLRAWRSWHTFEEGTDCRRWLFTICRNVFRRELRRRNAAVSFADDARALAWAAGAADGDAIAAVSSAAPEDACARMDIGAAMDTALEMVPEPYRSTLVLVHLEDHSYEAAAAMLDIPIGTVRSRLFRARHIVQQHLLTVAQDAGLRLAGDGAPAGETEPAGPARRCA